MAPAKNDAPRLKKERSEYRKAIEKRKRELNAQVSGNLIKIMQYTYSTLKNSFQKRPKTLQKGKELYLFDDQGGKICTMETFLKGAYRAVGSGSYQKEKVQTRVRGTAPPGTYHEKNQKPGVFYTKGTGKFSAEERANIEDARNPAASQRKIIREIRKREKRLTEFNSRGKETWSDEEKREAKTLGKELRQLKKRKAKSGSVQRTHKIRIVQHRRGDVPAKEVQSHVMFPRRSKPGTPPMTQSGKGMNLRKGLYYQLDKDKMGFTIYAVSLANGNLIFRNLEYGGTASVGKGRGELAGYSVSRERVSAGKRDGTQQQFSHRRISLRAVKRNRAGKRIRFEPRPFFEPAKERAIQRIQEVFGDEGAKFAKTVKLF